MSSSRSRPARRAGDDDAKRSHCKLRVQFHPLICTLALQYLRFDSTRIIQSEFPTLCLNSRQPITSRLYFLRYVLNPDTRPGCLFSTARASSQASARIRVFALSPNLLSRRITFSLDTIADCHHSGIRFDGSIDKEITTMKVYGYVSNENCVSMRFAKPGGEIDKKPVARHGDFLPWTLGKRATLAIIADPKESGWRYKAACAVACRLGWWELAI